MNSVNLTGKLETEPEIVTKNGRGQFFYFKLRVLNENENGYDRINCAVYGEKCVQFYSKCKLNDIIEVSGPIKQRALKVQNITVQSYNVVVDKFNVIAPSKLELTPQKDIKDEYLE